MQWAHSKKLKIESYDPAIPLLSFLPRALKVGM